MILDLQGEPLRRIEAEGLSIDDISFDDIVTATRTGPAQWLDDGQLEIPMDPEPTPEQTEQILRRLTTANANEEILATRARQALAANKSFLALTTPTNAQVLEQVRTLTRENTALIRLLMRWLDSTD